MKTSPPLAADLSDEPNLARKGKIACLPLAIRTELNRRLDDGGRGPRILEWLNAEPAVRAVLERDWSGRPVNPQNLSEWRRGGYVDWRRRCDEIEKLKELSAYARELGQAAGGITEACATLAAARIMEAVETAGIGEVLKMVKAISRLRAGETANARLEQQRRSLDQNDQQIELARQRFERETGKLFREGAEDDKIRNILGSGLGHAEKIERLGRALFPKPDEDGDGPVAPARPSAPRPGAGTGERQLLAAGLATCGDETLFFPRSKNLTRASSIQTKSREINPFQALRSIAFPADGESPS
jgi:hypothetical protein